MSQLHQKSQSQWDICDGILGSDKGTINTFPDETFELADPD
jgi:hypothetical protein